MFVSPKVNRDAAIRLRVYAERHIRIILPDVIDSPKHGRIYTD
jgi:hypothetical protein